MVRPVTSKLLVIVIVAVAVIAGCGSDTSAGNGDGEGGRPPDGPTTQEQRPPESAAEPGRSCNDITVPGHVATGVRTEGVSCDQVAQIVRGAVGRGRAAYRTAGFSCEPSPAGGGDTNYACTGGGARVLFRYGAG